jgi:MGT family glycosyltransferase
MYVYPLERDYQRAAPLGDGWTRLDSSVRAADAPFDIAGHVGTEGALIYLSLGSLGSVDVALMQRLIDALAETSHRVIVSMGPLHEQMRLGPNMYGEQFLPQTAILPHCDLVITHGGNNTIGEAFTFGLPAIVLPLFWDQYDNAQRVQELGYGVRLDTYGFDPDHLRRSVDELLADTSLRARMKQIASRVSGTNGQAAAADTIERILLDQ